MTDTSTRPRPSGPFGQSSGFPGLRRLRTRVRRAVLARRRPLAGLVAAGAVAAGVQAVAPPAPATSPVLVATRDLAAGATLSADDVAVRRWPVDAVPDGTATAGDVVGRVLAAPLRTGEPVTDVRVGAAGFATTEPGLTAVPVRLPDPGVAGLLAPGDRIDLIATDPADGDAETVAEHVLVLAVPAPEVGESGLASGSGGTPGGPGGRLVVVAVTDATTAEVSSSAVSRYLTVAFSR